MRKSHIRARHSQADRRSLTKRVRNRDSPRLEARLVTLSALRRGTTPYHATTIVIDERSTAITLHLRALHDGDPQIS